MPGPDYVSIIALGPPPYIDELSEEGMLNIYPNPASDRLYINTGIEYQSIEIMDMSGQAVLQSSRIGNEGLDISDLSSGTYVLRINNGKLFYSKAIVIN